MESETSRRRTSLKVIVYRILALLGFLGFWETTKFWVAPYFVSPPSRVIEAAIAQGPDLIRHISVTLSEYAVGFSLAASWGISLGYILAMRETVERVVDPYVMALYSVPTIALAPLFILIFGIGANSKIAMAAVYGGVPILVNTIVGVRNVDRNIVTAVRSLGGSGAVLFRKVLLPASLPYVMVGLRLGGLISLIGVIVGEFVAAYAGLGWLVGYAAGTFQTAIMFVAIILLAFIGLSINEIIRAIGRHFTGWAPARE